MASELNLDHSLLDQFIGRILELHKTGVLSEEDAIGELAEAFSLAANGNPNVHAHMKATLKKAWEAQ
jgi:hypothetical protein